MEKAPDGELIMLPCNLLEDHPLRLSYYSQAHLEGLYRSIKANGLLEPLLVWARGDNKYQILSGHYRVRAVRQLKQPVIACRLYTGDRHTALVIYCTANVLTRSISALEETLILHTLVKDEGYTDEATRLIQWWQSAGEKDRTLLEEGKILPGCGLAGEQRTDSIYQLVLKSLKKCTSLINEVISLLKRGECRFFWPDAQYRTFLMTVAILKELCPKGGELKGASGISAKAGEKGL